jgi:magnesium chelatase subunit H
MLKRISAAEGGGPRVTIVTLDNHLASAVDRARLTLTREIPGLELNFHAAADFNDPKAVDNCIASIGRADIIVATMLFMEEHAEAVLPALKARRDHCAAVIGCMSAPDVVKTTRIGRFNMDGSKRGAFDFLKKLRGKSKSETGGAAQLAMLKRIPKILRFIPGPAQDVRAYFLTLQYWLAGSDANVVNLVRFLLNRYADGPNVALRGKLKADAPIDYPEVGVYHPRMPGRVSPSADKLPARGEKGTVGLLLMRSYILADNTAHYDAVIAALEARGLSVVPAFANGLDARPAVEAFFHAQGRTRIDALLSLTGFSLVGGPAYNDSTAAAQMLAGLDVPYVAAQALEFQTLEQWEDSERGLSPVEATMMVAIPELDGATAPMVFGGRRANAGADRARDIQPHDERVQRLADRIEKLVRLRRSERATRKLAIVLFNFPPNGGATGTAAYLGVYASLLNTLRKLDAEGYHVDLPADEDELRNRILGGNAQRYGQAANVCARIPVDDHVRREPHLREIEAQWGPAPGKHQTDGAAIFVLGAEFGNVLVSVQPAFGYEGDPMRLLFERSFAPTHAFSAFYRYLREDFAAHAILHFGMHGALEFMPGKQVGMSAECWPERLIGATPNIYLYAANNPSEGALAKRRSAATLVSYLTPSLARAGLYRGLLDLKASLERYRAAAPSAKDERAQLATLVQAQAAAIDLAAAEPEWTDAEAEVQRLTGAILELEYTLIPHGLHVVGQPASQAERVDTLASIAQGAHGLEHAEARVAALVAGARLEDLLRGEPELSEEQRKAWEEIARCADILGQDHELPALIRALDGCYMAPVVGGDLMRTTAILPTGRNLHGFDPYRIPSAYSVADGARQVERVLQRYREDGNACPESVALVLWGTDNLKSEGGPIGQALAWIGAKPRFDAYGRLAGAALIPLEELGRPRIDVVVTLSGIFRDLLPLQTKLLAEACWLAASADEPDDVNFVRKHALAYIAEKGGDLETAALRVFSNAEGSYGANVGMLIDSSTWEDEDELGASYTRRKCFAYSRKGDCAPQMELLQNSLAHVDFAYQNLDSIELGVTTIEHYFDSLGAIGRAAGRARGSATPTPIYISDQTRGDGRVRSLKEQVALETRTRMLNPKWYEGLLAYGYEGVRQIEAHVTNTMGWSATTNQVDPWVYEQISKTFVLDPEMRKRLSDLNPAASAKLTNRVLEAHERGYWRPDAETLAALRDAGDELEDRLEGVEPEIAA